MVEQVDENGNLVLNPDGSVKMVQATDDAGNPLEEKVVKGGKVDNLVLKYYDVQLDANGNPVKDPANSTQLKSDYTVKTLTVPGYLFRAALVSYSGETIYWDKDEDYRVEEYEDALRVAYE